VSVDRRQAEELIAARLSPPRQEHARRVAAEAVALARRYGADPGAALIAGLLHDLCRELPDEEALARARVAGIPVGPVEARRPAAILHGPLAAAELRARGLDEETAEAIALHTVGRAGMSTLARCLYLADFCEPGRRFDGLDEVRALARRSLDEAVAAAARLSLLHLIGLGRGVVPAALDLYNEWHAGR